MAEPSDDIIQRAQRGEPEALGALIVSQQQYIYSIAMSVLRQPEDAADLTQEACVKLLRVIGQYNGESRFTTWLYRLVLNMGRDELRRRGRRVPVLAPHADDEGDLVDPLDSIADDNRWADPSEVANSTELRKEIARALERLEDHYRLALTLYYFDDLKYNDIAEILDVPLNTVKSYIRRGKERLAALLGEPESEPARPAR
ncbi:MAG TPA: RNA polymerase sigma factor, partial [Herpetosiphonaceae bacterium]